MNEHEKILSTLERSFSNPEIESILKHAIFLKESFIGDETLTDEAIREGVRGLNARIEEAGLTAMPVFITGNCWFPSGETDEYGNMILEDREYRAVSEREVMLHEFAVSEVPVLTEDGVDTERRLYLYGRSTERDEDGDEMPVEAVIDLDKDMTIRFEGITPEGADAWLDYYPEVKEDLQERLMNADTESQSIANLSDFTIDTQNIPDELVESLVLNLEVFMKKGIPLRRALPYILELVGDIEIYDIETQEFRTVEARKGHRGEAAMLYDISFEHDIETRELYPLVNCSIATHDDTDFVVCRVPLSSVRSVMSVRELMD